VHRFCGDVGPSSLWRLYHIRLVEAHLC
jgi:hypothetical protein